MIADFIIRNLIIGVAFGLYNASSLKIAGGPNSKINEQGAIWTAIISGVIFTTMHSQDMKDQDGDRSRGRRTAPIVLGDFVARSTIAIPIGAWSIICPWFWGTGIEGYLLTVPLGIYIVWKLYTDRTFKGDRASWKLWTLWTALLVSCRGYCATSKRIVNLFSHSKYLLPTMKQTSSFLFQYR